MPPELDRPAVDLSDEVRQALAAGRPVVALESTIICHGMPYPQNVETARRVEAEIRAMGAVPATIAVLEGKLTAGLNGAQIEYLGQQGNAVTKISRRDLPFVVARSMDGATTVAATMVIASLAGISVFATGGIGGVHRGVEETMDVSADLTELGRTDVAVVCAGVKSVLDIPKTVECLETLGVPVVGYQTDMLPAFYTRDSGTPVDYRAESAADIAGAMRAKWDLGLEGGMVIGVPIPEPHALDAVEIDGVIDAAIREMHDAGISGKETTPFLLRRIAEETDGRSLDANIELVVNNAKVAAQIATEYAALRATD